MTLLAIYDWLRSFNAYAGIAVTALLLVRVPAWARAPWPSKVGRLAVFGWVTATTYGTFEALSQSAVVGARIPAVTSMMALSAYYVAVEWRCDVRTRRATDAQVQALQRRDSPQAT